MVSLSSFLDYGGLMDDGAFDSLLGKSGRLGGAINGTSSSLGILLDSSLNYGDMTTDGLFDSPLSDGGVLGSTIRIANVPYGLLNSSLGSARDCLTIRLALDRCGLSKVPSRVLSSIMPSASSKLLSEPPSKLLLPLIKPPSTPLSQSALSRGAPFAITPP